MDEPKTALQKEGQSASNARLRCKICILEIQKGHYVGFLFGINESGLFDYRAVEETADKALVKCEARAKEIIPDCVLLTK